MKQYYSRVKDESTGWDIVISDFDIHELFEWLSQYKTFKIVPIDVWDANLCCLTIARYYYIYITNAINKEVKLCYDRNTNRILLDYTEQYFN